jgi:type IV pilus assembly protein PilV
MNHPPQRRQRGMTLIEVLVAILIFSFGLLGFVGLQARAIQFSTSAEDSSRAALLANELAAAMISQQTLTPSLTAWQARVADPAQGGLPSGFGSSSVTGNTALITITWTPTSAASGAGSNKYVTEVIL